MYKMLTEYLYTNDYLTFILLEGSSIYCCVTELTYFFATGICYRVTEVVLHALMSFSSAGICCCVTKVVPHASAENISLILRGHNFGRKLLRVCQTCCIAPNGK